MLSNQLQHGIDDVLRCNVVTAADRFGGFQCPAAGEYGEAFEHPPLCVREQLVTPIDGCTEGLLARQRGSVPTNQESKAPIEPRGQLIRRERIQACGCQLERERNTVQSATDLRYCRRIGV